MIGARLGRTKVRDKFRAAVRADEPYSMVGPDVIPLAVLAVFCIRADILDLAPSLGVRINTAVLEGFDIDFGTVFFRFLIERSMRPAVGFVFAADKPMGLSLFFEVHVVITAMVAAVRYVLNKV